MQNGKSLKNDPRMVLFKVIICILVLSIIYFYYTSWLWHDRYITSKEQYRRTNMDLQKCKNDTGWNGFVDYSREMEILNNF